MTAPSVSPRLAGEPRRVALRYVDCWDRPAGPASRYVLRRRVEPDPNPMPRFRLWRRRR